MSEYHEAPLTEESPDVCPQQAPKKSLAEQLLDYVEIIVFSICAVILLFTFVGRLCTVVGPSMEKTLHNGERLIVSDLFYEPERNDIIVFHQTKTLNEPVVKRVIATEGEIVNIDFSTWTLTVTDRNGNKEVIKEDYMYLDPSVPRVTSAIQFPYTVPDGHVFVLGDNRNHSADSRSYLIGPVDERRILGKVIFRITPFDKMGIVD